MTQLIEELTYEEIISLASTNKIELIDRLVAAMWKVGNDLALTNAEYYRQKYTGEKTKQFEKLTFDHARLEALWDMYKHMVSALQSTLRAEGPQR